MLGATAHWLYQNLNWRIEISVGADDLCLNMMLGQHQISTQAVWEMQLAIDFQLTSRSIFAQHLLFWLTTVPFILCFYKKNFCSQLIIFRDDLGLGVMSHPPYIAVVDLLQVSLSAVNTPTCQRSLAGIARRTPAWLTKTYKYIYIWYHIYLELQTTI